MNRATATSRTPINLNRADVKLYNSFAHGFTKILSVQQKKRLVFQAWTKDKVETLPEAFIEDGVEEGLMFETTDGTGLYKPTTRLKEYFGIIVDRSLETQLDSINAKANPRSVKKAKAW